MTNNKNRYYKHSRISETKFRQILRCFSMDLTATETSQLCVISVRSINSIYLKLRGHIVAICERDSPYLNDDESRGTNINPTVGSDLQTSGKQHLAFGIYLQNEFVYTEIAPSQTRNLLQQNQRNAINTDDLVSHASWKNYDGLVDLYKTHLYRITTAISANGEANNSCIEVDTFWNFAKRRLLQFNGIHQHTFYLHLKETEFRFNNRRDNLYRILMKELRSNPL
ncbi:MAG: hypothetical protein ACJAYG_000920 [Oceanicoccus sp.]|jgi:hypothetical protein